MNQSKQKLRIISAFVLGYMLFALLWWTILLLQKAESIHNLKTALNENETLVAEEYLRQKTMIIGEGLVFGLSLIAGIVLLNRGFKREIITAKQQKNFLLSVTHELKSPITAIQLILNTFKKRTLNNEQTSRLLNDGEAEVTRLKKLVDDLLISARLNTAVNIERENIDLEKIILPLIDQFHRSNPEFEIKLEKSNKIYNVNTNESGLSLIISNLLENAIKYSGQENKLLIKIIEHAEKVNILIEDFGVGIADKEKSNIFNQFYRIGDENIRSSQGTGLGLYIVSELCEKLNIKYSVSDNSPKGSIFALVVPGNK